MEETPAQVGKGITGERSGYGCNGWVEIRQSNRRGGPRRNTKMVPFIIQDRGRRRICPFIGILSTNPQRKARGGYAGRQRREVTGHSPVLPLDAGRDDEESGEE